MRILKWLAPAMLVVMLGLATAASAQVCTDGLFDTLGPTLGTYDVGETIEYSISFSIPPSPNPPTYCTLIDMDVYFFPPQGTPAGACDDPTAGVFIGTIPVLAPGDPAVVFTSADNPALAYLVQVGDAGGQLRADMGVTFYVQGDITGTQQCDEKTSVNFVNCPEPCVEITKWVDCDISKVGDDVIYTICVENCGDSALIDIVVTDDMLGDISSDFPTTLAPGDSACRAFTYTILIGDEPGPVENIAHVSAIDACDGTTPATDDSDLVTVNLIHPAFTVDKVCTSPDPTPIGGDVTFTITIENTGDCGLIINTDESEIPADLYLAQGAPPYEKDVTVSDAQPPCEFNKVIVTATIPPELCDLPNVLVDSAEVCCPVECDPCVEITKWVDCDISKVGDSVEYTICVENCGDVELTDIVVTDPMLGNVSGAFPASIAAGDSACRAFTYTILIGDEPGPVENIAHVDANGVCGDVLDPVSDDSDLVTVNLIHPAFTVDKVCTSPDPTPIGGDVTFTITIENTGDCGLIINTDESEIPADLYLADDDPPYTKDVTVSGAQPPCEFNKVIVTATIPPEYCDLPNVLVDSAEVCCPVECDPCVEITKWVDCDISKVGDDVIYTICVENCGDVELVDIVVTDPMLGNVSGAFPTSIAAGDSACRAFTYTILIGDEPGPVENIAHVEANGVCGDARDPVSDDSDLVTVNLIHPAFTVDKVCTSPDPTPIGGDVTFTITIENTGDCGLIINTDESEIPADLYLADDDPPYTKDVTVSGAQPPCEFNKVIVTATIPPEYCDLPNVLVDSAEVCCPVECDPCVEITKWVDCDISKVGDSVEYTICVENCGDVELTDIVVTDPMLGDVSGAFPASIAAGDSACRAFTYTILIGDEPGPVENIAHVDANGVCGDVLDPVSDDSDLVTVNLIHPAFTVDKVCTSPDPTPIGGDVTFTITIENTGDCGLIINTDESEIPADLYLADDDPPYTKDVTVSGAQPPCEFNKVIVTATIPPEYCDLPNVLVDSAEVCCPVECDPCVEITKWVDCDISKVGDDVIYTICVENCGDVELTDIVVTDPMLGNVSGAFPTSIAAGDSACRAFTYTILIGDEPGPVENIAHVDANGVCGDVLDPISDDSDLVTVNLIHPAFTVDKVCVEDPLTDGVTEAWYTVTITNTGDVALDFTTDDGDIGPLNLLAGDTHQQDVSEPVPAGVGSVCNKIIVTATIPPEFCDLQNVLVDSAEACCEIAGAHGCTPGYWKNQTECWECYSTTTLVCDVFTMPTGPLYDFFCGGNVTLHKALKFGGGEGIVGKARNLMRHGVAALLNACDSDVNYGMNPAGVIAMVNDALATEDETEITSVQGVLAGWNERGCSQDAHCNPQDPELDGPGGAPARITPTDVPGDGLDESRNPGTEGILQSEMTVPREFSVRGYPNPAGTSSSIRYALPMDSKVTVEILDVQGRLVTKLLDQHMPAGSHTVAWDGDGSPAGVYFCRVQCCDGKETVSKVIKVQ